MLQSIYLQELCLTHSGFYSDLSKACHSRHGTIKSFGHMTIADCFIKWKEKLLKYGDYCSQLNKVHLLLDKLMSNSASREAILVNFCSPFMYLFIYFLLLFLVSQRLNFGCWIKIAVFVYVMCDIIITWVTSIFVYHINKKHYFFQACQKDANQGKFRLWDLLSVPMQRVLKYHLLLKVKPNH